MRPFRTFLLCSLLLSSLHAADLRLGIIGTDTSHATAFATTLNDPNSPNHIAGAQITAAFKGGSPDVQESSSRVEKFAAQLRDKSGVRFVSKIEDLCPLVDGLLLESVDGRTHLEQFRQAAACGKPVFIDKPLASTLADALQIAQIAREKHIPWFSSSSLRYSAIAEMRNPDMTGAIVWAPGPTEPHQPLDLSWYGIHGIEMLYTLFGPGCQEVSRTSSPDSEVLVGRWRDGKLGVVHLQRPYGKYGAIVFEKNQHQDARPDVSFSYVPLVKEIVAFMQTKNPPVPNAVTLEMFAFMDAAQRSVKEGGKAVPLSDISGSATARSGN